MFGKKPPQSSPRPSDVEPPQQDGASPAPFPSQDLIPSASPGHQRAEESSLPVPVSEHPVAALRSYEPVERARAQYTDTKLETKDFLSAKQRLIEALLEKMDFRALEKFAKDLQKKKILEVAEGLLKTIDLPLNSAQQELLKIHVVDEVFGFGPIEPLLADPDVSDIMINTHKQVYIEKSGKIYLTDISFSSEGHLLAVIQKIVSLVGRRIDENSPMVDARMPDGSRFNAIIPPLALDGGLVSIRKFKKNKMPLRQYISYGSMSENMCRFLEICANIRLNIIISGGTGSGKTTLLNALSGHIDHGERVVTIEDAAELQLLQPHVLRLETRPANTEGVGEVTQRQLLRNALRMRPDRIILGEIRGDEVIDVLAAMNTGHDGSMATIHSNSPRDCLSRIENLVGMTGLTLPTASLRNQIASAIHLIVQIARMRDGKRRITHVEEVVGMEGDVITTQTIFSFKSGMMDESGVLRGEYQCSGIRPRFLSQAAYFNRDKELIDCIM